jgi:hypothetical protein
MRREALNDALRSMLQLATYELMVQLMPPAKHKECTDLIDPRYGQVTGAATAGRQSIEYEQKLEGKEATAESEQPGSNNDGTDLPPPENTGQVLPNEGGAMDDAAEAAGDLKAEQGGAAYADGDSSNDVRIFRPKQNLALPSHTMGSPSSW